MKIRNATLRGRDGRRDIQVDKEIITALSPATGEGEGYDAAGRLVVPQFAEAHIHLDYANTEGVPRRNESGSLFEAIQIWGDRKKQGLHDKEDVKSKARAATSWWPPAVRAGADVIGASPTWNPPEKTGWLP